MPLAYAKADAEPELTDVRPRAHDETPGVDVQRFAGWDMPTDPRAVLGLQRSVGNAATAQLLQRHAHAPSLPTVQRCGSTPASECGCHGNAPAMEAQLDVQRAGGTPAPGLEAAQPCSVGDRLLAFTTWAIATTKLGINVPALALAKSTGLRTSNLKSNLTRHFGVAANDKAEQTRVIGILSSGYQKILSAMVGGIEKVSCGGTQCRPNDYAYVYPAGGVNRVFFCDVQRNASNLFSDPLDLASTWVHELSHLLLATADNEYYNHSGSTTLATAQALANADCWGNFMVEY